jgi:hypothetical protein
VTQDDILDALRAALGSVTTAEGERGVTTEEYAAASGKSPHMGRRDIKALLAAGKAVPVRVRRVNMAGVSTSTMGYRLA